MNEWFRTETRTVLVFEGQKFRALRRDRGVSQTDLAGMFNWGRTWISRIEKGQLTPSAFQVEELLRVLTALPPKRRRTYRSNGYRRGPQQHVTTTLPEQRRAKHLERSRANQEARLAARKVRNRERREAIRTAKFNHNQPGREL